MLKILLAVDGSESALRATRKLIETAALYKERPEVELVTVHRSLPPAGGFADVVVSQELIERYYGEEGGRALAPSGQLLAAAGVKYAPHILIGDIAPTIVEHGRNSGCHMIYMGTRGMTAISNLVVGSIATRVLHLTRIPVVLIH